MCVFASSSMSHHSSFFLSFPGPCRKLTLESLYWTAFDSEEERATHGRQFVQLVQEQLSKPVTEVCVQSDISLIPALSLIVVTIEHSPNCNAVDGYNSNDNIYDVHTSGCSGACTVYVIYSEAPGVKGYV